MLVVFIVVPKNSGLRKYREISLRFLEENLDISRTRIIEARGEDVPFWVEEFSGKGQDAIGLTGEDLYIEYCLARKKGGAASNSIILKKIRWDDDSAVFGKPTLCLIGSKDKSFESLPKELTVCISSKYKEIAESYLSLLEKKGYSFKRIYVKGCVEVSCSEGIADLIIDIVYTGASLGRYGLQVYDRIRESDFVIMASSGVVLCTEEKVV